MASPPTTRITFLTDVEGDGAYFDRFVRHSKVLEFRSIEPRFGRYSRRSRKECVNGVRAVGTDWNLGEWEEDYFPYDKEVAFRDGGGDGGHDDSMLVYGGDIWDKGGSDLYVLRQLLSLHRRHPHRVHFLMGNRDINKMRIVDEVGIGDIHYQNESLPKHGGVYWLRGAVCSGLPEDPESVVPSDSASERLRWMLQKTMGSVDAFELRRRELERERFAVMNETSVSPAHRANDESSKVTVTDEEVAQSYIRSCDPASGIMSQYLTRANLALRFGSLLFLHGSFPFVPSGGGKERSPEFPTPWIRSDGDGEKSGCRSLAEWVDVLNDFASSKVRGWKEYRRCRHESPSPVSSGVWATEGGYFNDTRGGKMFGALVQYGMGTLPDRAKTLSCVYNSWMHDGLPREDVFGDDDSLKRMSELFSREGVQIVLTGHQPVGDAPWPIQISREGEESKLWILPCDTSFSGDTRWTSLEGFDSTETSSLGRGSPTSGRGEVAFSEPIIYLNRATQRADSVTIHGCLSDGTHYETGNLIDANGEDCPLLGRRLGQYEFKDEESGDGKKGTFWVKGKVGQHHLATYGEGFDVWNAYIKLGRV